MTAVHGGGASASQTYGGIGHYIGARNRPLTGAETRVTVLGHVQRGGSPAERSGFGFPLGVHAVDLIAQGKFDRMVAWSNRRVIDVPIDEAIKKYQAVDPRGRW